MPSLERASSTATRILDAAERLAQTRGLNGFSYADIASEVGITTASLHYHFPTKAHLAEALVVRYSKTFHAALGAIPTTDNAATRVRAYVRIYREVLSSDRMCLCGMFAAEYATLAEPVRAALRRFFDQNETWLIEVLEQGRQDGTLSFIGPAQDVAALLTGALEGAMLLARSYEDASRFTAPLEHLLSTLIPPASR